MNSNGFWGKDEINHLQFQQGYHQYEIFEYLGVEIPKIKSAINLLLKIADKRGQFAPYFGGGGCYDYDATYILTYNGRVLQKREKRLLKKTISTILSEQNEDGGFSDSQWIRPRTFNSMKYWIQHVFSLQGLVRYERLRYFLAMQRSKHCLLYTSPSPRD